MGIHQGFFIFRCVQHVISNVHNNTTPGIQWDQRESGRFRQELIKKRGQKMVPSGIFDGIYSDLMGSYSDTMRY
jgi:hypothetical protein